MNTLKRPFRIPANVLPVSSTCRFAEIAGAKSRIPAAANAEATSEEQIIKLPLPRLVSFAIWLASLSIWNISPLNFSTDQRPFASTSKSKIPAVAEPDCAPGFAVAYTVRISSRLISARISVERIFASSSSASNPCTAFISCASSTEYFAFNARDLASTVSFSISNPISLNAGFPSEPNSSAAWVVIPEPEV